MMKLNCEIEKSAKRIVNKLRKFDWYISNDGFDELVKSISPELKKFYKIGKTEQKND